MSIELYDYSTNIALLGKRDTGKTTALFETFQNLVSASKTIIVFDSATEHKYKSLIHKIKLLGIPHVYMTYNEEKFAEDKKVFLIDVSKYLEMSHLMSVSQEKSRLRSLYKQAVARYLSIMNDVFEGPYTILMDEIEFIPETIEILKKINAKRNYFINAIHGLDYIIGYEYRTTIINMNMSMVYNRDSLPKKVDIMCGDACVEMVIEYFYGKQNESTGTHIWCGELALILAEHKIHTEMYCFNSNLFEAYKNKNRDIRAISAGLQALDNYAGKGCVLAEKELTEQILLSELKINTCMIMCVDSASFNQDDEMSGGHFIVVFYHEGIVFSLNPQKTKILKEIHSLSRYVSSCAKFGGWRILCY